MVAVDYEKARRIRDGHFGSVITYSRKVFVPLTNLCLDRCGYCVFAKAPKEGAGYLTPDQVLEIAEMGKATGCKEALFSLGERPELRYSEAREQLKHLGYRTTLEYLRAMCELVLEKTGLLPHSNAGTLSESEMLMLRPVNGSMGMMLESVSERLLQRGEAHFKCPDKVPATRLATLETAGRLGVPFTTGILIGIGETREERVETLKAIERIHQKYGTIQEVIVQNFRQKPDIAMANAPEPTLGEMLEALAIARNILSPEISLQAPPNLMPESYVQYIDAGLNDWGGISPVTADHINPERAWPKIDELAKVTASKGFELRERLTLYPRFLADPEKYIDPSMREPIRRMAA